MTGMIILVLEVTIHLLDECWDDKAAIYIKIGMAVIKNILNTFFCVFLKYIFRLKTNGRATRLLYLVIHRI